ncbi:MAG: hypothetical protein QOK13_267 [Gaiellaceae bacterium]|nr:hypothetical protein [Gaiellaceae bacterium]
MSELALARPSFRALPVARIVGIAASLLFLAAIVSRSVRAFGAPGSEMDEGDPLVYGERVLGGDLPWRNFETFYGPANPYLVAFAFRLLGVSVFAERMVGMTFRLVLCAALLSLAWRFGLAGLLSSGLVLLILVPAGEIWAWPGSEAVAAIALTVALLAAAHARESRALAIAAGVAAGATVLIRFDYAPAVALAALPFLWRGGISRKRFGLAAAATAGLYLPLLGAAGRSRILQVAGDISRGTAGRKLPLPDLTSYPGNLLAASVLASVVLVVAGSLLRSRVSLALGLASLATLPHTLGRPDEVHILAGCVLSLVLLPAVLVALVRHLDARSRVSAALVLVAVAAAGFGVARASATGNLGPLLNTLTMRGANVEHGGRTFPLADRDTRRDVQRIVDAAGAAAPAGSKLFVGPRDLRRTNYADTYIYFLLPEFEPASFYVELEPGTLNQTATRSVSELARADVLILTSRHDDWHEPNASIRFRSAAPNRYVATHFCARAHSGTYTLLVRCA